MAVGRSTMHSRDEASGLDFTSSDFDALKVLHTDPRALQLPFPNVQPCDNLDAYESGEYT